MSAPVYDRGDLAAQFGYAESFFSSDPELSRLIDQAVREQWTPERFTASLLNTNWYRGKTEAQRKWEMLKAQQPAEATRRIDDMKNRINAIADQLDTQISGPELQQLADEATRMGWDDLRIEAALKNSAYYRDTASSQRKYDELLRNNPADLRQMVNDMSYQIRSVADRLNVQVDEATINKMSEDATRFGWDTTRIEFNLKNTPYFRSTTESQRAYDQLKTQSPAELQKRMSETRLSVQSLATQLGLSVGGTQLTILAERALREGWDQNRLQRELASTVKVDPDAPYNGAVAAEQIRSYARDMGLNLAASMLTGYTRELVAGTKTMDMIAQDMQRSAILRFKGITKDIEAGKTVREMAMPYISSWANILEVSPESIDLNSAYLSRALNYKDPSGKGAGEYGAMPIYEFEKLLRKDPKWTKTKNARDAASSMVRQLGIDMGFAY